MSENKLQSLKLGSSEEAKPTKEATKVKVEKTVAEKVKAFEEDAKKRGIAVAYADCVAELSIYPPGVNYEAVKLAGEFLSEFMPQLGQKPTADYPEMGDVYWYITANCRYWSLEPDVILNAPAAPKIDWGKCIVAVGRICEASGKRSRDMEGKIDPDKQQLVRHSLITIAVTLKRRLQQLELTLDGVLAANLTKLYSRQERGVIKGDGDTR